MALKTRKFSIVNGDGVIWDLMDPNFFAKDPEGLGININHTYVTEGNSYKKIKSEIQNGDISLTLMIGGMDPYLSYLEFCHFLNKHPLQLRYEISGPFDERNYIYLRDIEIGELPKEEINKWGILEPTIKLDKTSPWYVWVKNEVLDLSFSSQTKIFNIGEERSYIPSFAWSYYGRDLKKTGNINNESILLNIYEDTPFRLTIKPTSDNGGAVVNPEWKIVDNKTNDVLYYQKFNVTVPVGSTMIVSSEWFDLKMVIIDSGGVETDVSNTLTLSSNTYTRLPVGDIKFVPTGNKLENLFKRYYGKGLILEYKLERVVV